MKQLLAVLVLLSSLSLEAQRRRPSAPPAPPSAPPAPQSLQFGAPLPNLPPSLMPLFGAGRRQFVDHQTVADGLGPIFNGRSCGECHFAPITGGSGGRVVLRIGTVVNGVFDPLTHLGGSLLQGGAVTERDGATHSFRGETPPKEATIVARRRTTTLFGLGLVDATDDATFIALAQQQSARNDGTAGRVALVDNIRAGMKTVGKFGWKAQVPTLHQFSGEAYLNELGITSPDFPDEHCPSGKCDELRFNPQPGLNDSGVKVDATASYMRFLGPPPRGPITADVTAGEAVFLRIGCDACHTPALQTGRNENPALDRVTYHPFSDFLLHDMGSLGDGIEQGAAKGTEMRTAPLWGLRVMSRFLHDGRATTLEDAILAHDGQGLAARERFAALNATDRARLLAFLRSL